MSSQPIPGPSPSNRRFPDGDPQSSKNGFKVEVGSHTQSLAPISAETTVDKFDLEVFLKQIADRALKGADGDGSVIALRRQGRFVCVAKSGGLGPEVGAELDARSGISGECLRTGYALKCDDSERDPRVDADACRRLGICSIVVVPIVGQSDVVGLVEVFSTRPNVFERRHIETLQQLATLVAQSHERVEKEETASFRQVWALQTPYREGAPTLFGAGLGAQNPGKWWAAFWLRPYQAAVVAGFLVLDLLAIFAWYHR
jgi:hypothetical protein